MIAFNSLYHKKHKFVITFLGEYDFFENTAYTHFIITYDEKNVNDFEVFFVNVLYKCDYNFKKMLLPPFQNTVLYAIIELRELYTGRRVQG